MIQPEDIIKKADNLYREFLKEWLVGIPDFFPRTLPVDRTPDADLAKAATQVQNLRAGAKQVTGHGYSVEWEEINSRRFGKNLFPKRVYFETREDLLRFVGKEREFAALVTSVTQLRQQFPELESWITSNSRVIIASREELPRLIAVANYFKENPRPNRFVRELPLSVDTKFIERHKGILRHWLDRILPAHTIRADEEHFERRFGLRYAEPDLFVRFLDPDLQHELGFPCSALSLPLSTLISLQIQEARVVIVENRVNLLTLPQTRRCIGLGGIGRAVTLLRYLPWLTNAPIIYWGDIDVDGFEILSIVRALFPQTRSALMDLHTLELHRKSGGLGNSRNPASPTNLTNSECGAFTICVSENLRIEQERLPAFTPEVAFASTIAHRDLNP